MKIGNREYQIKTPMPGEIVIQLHEKGKGRADDLFAAYWYDENNEDRVGVQMYRMPLDEFVAEHELAGIEIFMEERRPNGGKVIGETKDTQTEKDPDDAQDPTHV